MKQLFGFISGALLLGMASCADSALDPLQLDKITKGSLICLRGDAYSILQTPAYLGACDTFSVSNPGAESFDMDVIFIAEDVSSLAEIEVYARPSETGARVRVKSFPGSGLSIPSGETYPVGKISVPLSEILTAMGKTVGDFPANQPSPAYIFIECDLKLADGSVIPSSSIVNSSLYETEFFYPAHRLRYLPVN